tara:strand:+ start:4424 stop:4873 length:450 start_codon:yes stop_codon:yes gene_type:complete
MKYVGKISSNLDILNLLNKKYNWIPNTDNVRPNNDILERKNKYLKDLEANHGSIKDGIICDIFDMNKNNLSCKKKFIKNRFGYNINSNHYVMWYLLYNEKELSDDIINMDIYFNLYELLQDTNFNFAWYVNPKMSISDIFHVQVFWIKN